MNDLRLYRGLKENLPVLENGQPAFTSDTRELFVGSNGTNVIPNKPKVFYVNLKQSDLNPTKTATISVVNLSGENEHIATVRDDSNLLNTSLMEEFSKILKIVANDNSITVWISEVLVMDLIIKILEV